MTDPAGPSLSPSADALAWRALTWRQRAAVIAAILAGVTAPTSLFFSQIFVFVLLWLGLPDWQRVWRTDRAIVLAVAGVGASWVLSWGFSPRGGAAFYEAKDMWPLPAFVSVVALRPVLWRHRWAILAGFGGAMAAAAIIGIGQFAVGYNIWRGEPLESRIPRAVGFFRSDSSITFAGVMTVGLHVFAVAAIAPAADLAILPSRWRGVFRAAAMGVAGLSLAAVIVSQTRAYLLAVPVLGMVWAASLGRRALIGGWLLMIAGVAAIVMAMAASLAIPGLSRLGLPDIAFERNEQGIFEVSVASNKLERVVNWHIGLEIVRDYPFTGTGQGPTSYEWVSRPYGERFFAERRMGQTFFTNLYGHSHNNFLQIFAETGLVGFAATGVLALALIQTYAMAWRDSHFPSRTAPAMNAGLLVLIFLPGMVEYNLGDMEFLLPVMMWLGIGHPCRE